ncbi:6819_t:CDS:2, partial [Acaulospora morrowiae]
EDIGALSDRVKAKEPESSERDVNAVEAGNEPGKDGKLVTLKQVKECHYGRKRDDQREDEPRSTVYETAPASKEHYDEMRKSRGNLVVTEIYLERGQRSKRTESIERGMMSETSGSRESNRIDGGPTIGIPDKGENKLDSRDKIVSINTIEPIKKKKGLGVDNGVRKNQDNMIQPTSREPDGYRNDGTILAKRDIHPSERNGVVMVLTGDITIASCDNPGGRSKKKNGELNTDGLIMKRPKANKVELRYRDEEWITIYERDAHPPESKTEHETEGGMMFVSTWEPWDPEDSRNDDVTKEESTNDDKLADQDH